MYSEKFEELKAQICELMSQAEHLLVRELTADSIRWVEYQLAGTTATSGMDNPAMRAEKLAAEASESIADVETGDAPRSNLAIYQNNQQAFQALATLLNEVGHG